MVSHKIDLEVMLIPNDSKLKKSLSKFKDKDVADTKDGEDRSYKPPEIKDHRALNIRSVIDVHAWDQARWRGTAYAQFSPTKPPCVAFLFENEEISFNEIRSEIIFKLSFAIGLCHNPKILNEEPS